MNYFVGSQYRSPNSFELKGWYDIRTHEDLWDWQQIHFAGLYHVQTYYNGDYFNKVRPSVCPVTEFPASCSWNECQ